MNTCLALGCIFFASAVRSNALDHSSLFLELTTPAPPVSPTDAVYVCGQPASELLEDILVDFPQNQINFSFLEYCQDEYDYFFQSFDFSGAYNLDELSNEPPRVGGSGWALLMDGEADLLRGSTREPIRAFSDAVTFMWWMQGMEFSYFHELLNIVGDPSNLHAFTSAVEVVMDVWLEGQSAIAADVLSNFHFSNTAFPGKWVHVAVVWSNNGTVFTYMNGKFSHEMQIGKGVQFKDDHFMMVVGNSCTSGIKTCGVFETSAAWAGLFDELQVYNYALTADQVAASFSYGKRATPGPVLDLALNVEFGQGNIAIDVSGHGNDMEAYGRDISSLDTPVQNPDDPLVVIYWDIADADEEAGPTWVASTVPTIGLGDFVFSVPRDQELAVVLPAMDPDNDTLVWFIEEAPLNGTLYQTSDGVVRGDVLTSGMEVSHPGGMVIYVPNQDAFNGSPLQEWALHPDLNPIRDNFSYCVEDTVDNRVCSDAYILQNQPPYARSNRYWIQEDADLIMFFPCFDQDGDLPVVVLTSIECRGHVYDHDYYAFPLPPEDIYPFHNLRTYPYSDTSTRRMHMFYGDEILEFPYLLNDTGRRIIFAPLDEDHGTGYCNISYYCLDRFNQSSQEALVVIDVLNVDDAPTADDLYASINEDESIVILLQASDPDDVELAYVVTSVPASTAGTLYRINVDLSLGDPIQSGDAASDLVQYAIRSYIYGSGLAGNMEAITGFPDHYPAPGQSAYTMDLGNAEGVTLEFEFELFTTEVWVYETRDPGAIRKVSLVKTPDSSAERVLWEGSDIPQDSTKARIFKPRFCFVDEKFRFVRLYFNSDRLWQAYPNIDAVALVGSMTDSSNRLENRMVALIPFENYNGDVTFTYKAGDCTNDSEDADVQITVNAINDPPTISGATLVLSPGCSMTQSLEYQIQDVDSAVVSTWITNFSPSLVLKTTSGALILHDSLPFSLGSSRTSETVALSDGPNEDEAVSVLVCVDESVECDDVSSLGVELTSSDGFLDVTETISVLCEPPPHVETVVLGVLLPLHSKDPLTGSYDRYLAGTEALASLTLAVQEINDKQDGVSDDVLPTTRIRIIFNDTLLVGGTAREAAQYMLAQKVDGVPVTVFICCEDESLSKDVYEAVAASRNVLQVSYHASSPEFSSVDTYTYFYRTIPSLSEHVKLIVHALVEYGWGRFSVIFEDSAKWEVAADDLLGIAKEESLDVMRVVEISNSMAHSRIINDLGPLKNTSIIIALCDLACEGVLEASEELEMLGFGLGGYTWITISEQPGRPPLAWSDDFNMQGGFYTELCNTQQKNCTDIDGPSCETTTLDRWQAQSPICDDIDVCQCSNETDALGAPLWMEVDGSACLGISFDTFLGLYSSFLYDSVYAIAMALETVIPETESTTVSTSSLAAAMKTVSFVGHTGDVSFGSTGARDAGVCVSLQNFVSMNDSIYVGSWYGDQVGYVPCDENGVQCGQMVYATADRSSPNPFCYDGSYLDRSDENSDTYLFCLPCPAGLQSYVSDMTSCSSCGEEYCPQDDCFAGEFYNAKAYEACGGKDGCHCLPCQPGNYSQTSGSTSCLPCPLGFFTPELGLTKCLHCEDDEYLDVPGQSSCFSCPGNTLRKVNTDGTSVDQCTCIEGYWTGGHTISKEQGCVVCVEGGYCAGSDATPVPVSGFWGDRRKVDQFWKCNPQHVCEGDFVCASGYEGFLCRECSDGYFALAQACHKCPTRGLSWLLFGGLLLQLYIWIVIYQLAITTHLVLHLLYCLQALWLVSLIRLEWNDELLLFRSMGIFGFKSDYLSPACLVSWTFEDGSVVQFLLPVFVFLCSIPNASLRKESSPDPDPPGSYCKLPVKIFRSARLYSAAFTVVDIIMLPVFVRIWSAFPCQETSDGVHVLFWAPNVMCETPEHAQLIALSVIALLLYGLCWPMGLLAFIRRSRAVGGSKDPRFSPHLFSLFACYHETWCFFIDWSIRVALSIVVSFAFREPVLQAVVCSLLLVVALCFHLYTLPYTNSSLNVLKVVIIMYLNFVLCCGVLNTSTSYDDQVEVVSIAIFGMLATFASYLIYLDVEALIGIRGLKSVRKKRFESFRRSAKHIRQILSHGLWKHGAEITSSTLPLGRPIAETDTGAGCKERVYAPIPHSCHLRQARLPSLNYTVEAFEERVMREIGTCTGWCGLECTELPECDPLVEEAKICVLREAGKERPESSKNEGLRNVVNHHNQTDSKSRVDLTAIIRTNVLLSYLVMESAFTNVPSRSRRTRVRFLRNLRRIASTLAKTGYWMFGLERDIKLNSSAQQLVSEGGHWLHRTFTATGVDGRLCIRAASDPYIRVLAEYGSRANLVLWLLLKSTAAERAACARVLVSMVQTLRCSPEQTLGGAKVVVEEKIAFLLYSVLVASEEETNRLKYFISDL